MNRKTLMLSFFCLAMLIGGKELSAQKCRYAFDRYDPVSKERVRSNEVISSRDFDLILYRRANDYRIRTFMRLTGVIDFVVPVGHPLTITLGNGEFIEVTNSTIAKPKKKLAGVSQTEFRLSFKCTEEQMQKIAEHGFNLVSVSFGDYNKFFKPRKKEFEKNKKKTACLLKD